MYIRESKTTNKKTGKVYIKHTLVESIRTAKGPRQKLVMTLGRLTLDRSLWKSLAFALESYLNGEQEVEYLNFFNSPEELIEEITHQRAIIDNNRKLKAEQDAIETKKEKDIREVDVNSLSVTESRSLGPELVANNAWELLEFESILQDCGFKEKEIALAAAVIWGRLINPGSDIATWRWLREKSSLNDFFNVDISKVHKDKVYGIADKLLKHKDKLESRLYKRQKDIFSKEDTLFLFDLTNFYFEGNSKANELAERGKSKEKRNQNCLVSLALIVDEDGFPVKSKVFEGNVNEPATLETILKECGVLDSSKKDELPFLPIIAMDRGIATSGNLKFLRSKGFPFTVIERANRTKEFRKEFQTLEGFTQITDSKGQAIHLKQIGSKVLCLSEAKAKKEKAMLDGRIKKTCKELDKLVRSVSRWSKSAAKRKEVDKKKVKKIKDERSVSDKFHEGLGKIKKSCVNFDKLFKYQFDEKNGMLSYQVIEDKDNAELHGAYVIESNNVTGTEKQIWRLYMTLNNVENAFRAMKSDLGTRPVYHQGAERTKAHLFLSILAYHMLRNIEYRYAEEGEAKRWSSLKEILSTHQRVQVSWSDANNKKWFKLLSAKPEVKHRDIYFKLGVKNKLQDHIYST